MGAPFAAAAVLLLAVTACAETQANFVVTLDDYSMSIAARKAEEGNILIDIDNAGDEPHEIVVLRAEESGELPVTPDGAVDIGSRRIVDRIRPLPPGPFRMMSPDMRFGTYVLFCNLVTTGPDGVPVAHYSAGMRGTIEVEPFAAVTQDG